MRTGELAPLETKLGVQVDADTEKRFRDKPVMIISELIRTDD